MSYEVKIIADSIGPNRARITTFQLRYAMRIHWDMMTHRAFSRNASSGRSISVSRMAGWVEDDPFVPPHWTRDRAGMRAGEPLDEATSDEATRIWIDACHRMIESAKALESLGVHRQDANGLLVPFGWINVCVTATDFTNFFALRCHHAARPEMRTLATMMAAAYRDSTPTPLQAGWWHLPYITDVELAGLCEARSHPDWGAFQATLEVALKCSVARCGHVTHIAGDRKATTVAKDIERFHRFLEEDAWSTFEHQARAQSEGTVERSGNLVGWDQYRQLLPKNVHESFDFSVIDNMGEI